MRRTLVSLMALGVISGCGDGSTGAASSGDKQAPSIAFKTPAAVEGGETVALSAVVTDNVDTGLAPTLSCNGGTVVGSLLVTAPVTADATIRCTATATDKAGNVGTAVADVVVKATVASLALADASGKFAAGQVGMLVANNLSLPDATYQATLDGAAITLTRSGGFLVFAVPTDLAAGAHRIVATIGARIYSFGVTTTAAAAIADPKTAVRTALTAARVAVDALIASDGATMTADVRTQFVGYSTQLGQGLAQLDTMSAGDLNRLAIQLQANHVFQPEDASAFALSSCGSSVVSAAALSALTATALVGSVVALSTPGFQLLGLGLLAANIRSVRLSRNALVSAWDNCLTETSTQLVGGATIQAIRSSPGDYVTALAITQRYGFTNNTPQSLTVQHTLAIDPSVADRLNGAIALFLAAGGASPYASSPDVEQVKALPTERTEAVPASELTLGTISSPLVTGVKAGSGDAVTLTFRTANPPDANINFDFVLNRVNGDPITVPAQLTLALPGADDAAVEATQGQALSTTLHVRGQTSLEIVTPPAHGAATLSNAGVLSYTPSSQYFGDDRITYRARNASGVSATATVLISVVRKFEGYWDYKIVATVTSETQKYTCTRPDRNDAVFDNLTGSGTFVVNRVSDTQYTTTYRRTPVTLTMAGRDDPAGLKGSVTVNYTGDAFYPATDTISLSFPDSAHLVGTGTFLWTTGSNNSCRGTLTFTGAPAQ